MEQFIFLLVIAAISLIKWLMEKSAEHRAKRKMGESFDRDVPAPPIRAPRPTASPIPDMDTAARKLREALGLPDEAEMPPPRPSAPDVPPPVPTFHFEEVKVIPKADLEQRVVTPPSEEMERKARAFRRRAQQPVAAAAPARSGLDELLRSREGLRKAILAQEILGTPKGLVF